MNHATRTDGELGKKNQQCWVIDTCEKWVTFNHVSICKLLMIHGEVSVKAIPVQQGESHAFF